MKNETEVKLFKRAVGLLTVSWLCGGGLIGCGVGGALAKDGNTRKMLKDVSDYLAFFGGASGAAVLGIASTVLTIKNET